MMSRSYKISLLLKIGSSLPVYVDLASLSDRELDQQVRSLFRRLCRYDSKVITRLAVPFRSFSLN